MNEAAGTRGLSANAIKWIAITAMLIDHIAWGFVPTYSLPGQVMHVIGRITGPTMCYFLAEGYAHTRSVKKYALRLAVFAVIALAPYQLFEHGKFGFWVGTSEFDVIYTLLCALLAIWVWDKVQNSALRSLLLFGLMVLACFGDWMFFNVMFALVFWTHRGDFREQAINFTAAALLMVAVSTFFSLLSGGAITDQLFQFGVLLCLPILSLYNKQLGGGRNSKWTFYIFYPAHLLVLGLIKLLVV